MTGYVFANVEIPAYTSLIAVAEAADHGETKRVDDPCIAMARWLLVRLPDVTKSYLPRAASRNRSVVHPFRFASSGQALSVASAGYPRFALRSYHSWSRILPQCLARPVTHLPSQKLSIESTLSAHAASHC